MGRRQWYRVVVSCAQLYECIYPIITHITHAHAADCSTTGRMATVLDFKIIKGFSKEILALLWLRALVECLADAIAHVFMTSYAAFFLESMHLPVVMFGDRDGFDRFFVLLFQWRHCYRGYREVWGSADMKGPQGLRIAHIGTGVFSCWADAVLVFCFSPWNSNCGHDTSETNIYAQVWATLTYNPLLCTPFLTTIINGHVLHNRYTQLVKEDVRECPLDEWLIGKTSSETIATGQLGAHASHSTFFDS